MLSQRALTMLQDTIVPFWKAQADKENGGFYGYVGFDLKPDKKAEKGCILMSRILWFFSEAAKTLQDQSLLTEAGQAYDFIHKHALDSEHGGVYWSLSYDGQVLDDSKHTYAQAFLLYGLSAYYAATRRPEVLAQALEIYKLLETRCRLDEGYGEAYDRTFRPIGNAKLSENGVLASRTMNTLLHVLEAYAGLYEVHPFPELALSIRRLLLLFHERIYHPKLRQLEVFFDSEWNSLLDLHSFGHDIEASWLLDWAAGLVGADEELANRTASITSTLADHILETAFHEGSLWNEREGESIDKHRIWWVQAEGVVGFLNAYAKHPSVDAYRQAADDLLRYIERFMVDQRDGSEWFWRVDEEGHPDIARPFVEPWKCPYHNGRMCLEILRREKHAAP